MIAKGKPVILIVDDENSFRNLLMQRLTRKGNLVYGAKTGEEVLTLVNKTNIDVAIVDIKLPTISGIEVLRKLKESQPLVEVIILTGFGSMDTAIEALRLGAYDYRVKPCELREIEIFVEKAFEKKVLSEQNILLKEEIQYKSRYPQIIGASEKINAVLELIEKAARVSTPVLIEGESGTGKELVANAIHSQSKRANGSFISVNCAGLQESLLENELFGHEKGAFTGAITAKRGLIEIASGGTLFIDEVGDMPALVQAKLLRVLENKEFRRLGGNEQIKADIRIVAATNKDLLEEVKKKEFRADLLYRINTFTIHIPPLRERVEDIPLLTDHFLRFHASQTGKEKKVSKEVIDAFEKYTWPGNIRELSNIIERTIIISNSETVTLQDLPKLIFQNDDFVYNFETKGKLTLKELEKDYIHTILKNEKGNKAKAAKKLGISLRNLYRKIADYEISI